MYVSVADPMISPFISSYFLNREHMQKPILPMVWVESKEDSENSPLFINGTAYFREYRLISNGKVCVAERNEGGNSTLDTDRLKEPSCSIVLPLSPVATVINGCARASFSSLKWREYQQCYVCVCV